MDGAVAEKEVDQTELLSETPPQEGREVAKVEEKPIASGGTPAAIIPQDTGEIARFANFVWTQGMAPSSFKSPGQIAIAIMAGYERGKPPMWCLRNIYVVNNIPTIWGDGAVALVYESGKLEKFEEWWDSDTETAHCVVKRKGMPDTVERSFSAAQAARAGLTGRDTYKKYIERMCQWRARHWAIRDGFADVLEGLPIAEEIASATPGYAVTIGVNGTANIEDQTDRIDNALSDEGVPDVDGNDEDIVDIEVEEEPAVDEVEDEAPSEGEVVEESTQDFDAKFKAFETVALKAKTREALEVAFAEHGCEQWPDKDRQAANHVFNMSMKRIEGGK